MTVDKAALGVKVEKIPTPFSWITIKKNPAVVPVIAIVAGGLVMSFGYLARLAIKCPDMSWQFDNKKRPNEPWNRYEKKEYKFYTAENFDATTYEHPRPRF